MIDKKYLKILDIKPVSYRKDKSTIIVNEKYVFKDKKKDLNNLFKSLKERGFNNFPNLLYSDDNINVFEYIKEDKKYDLVDIVSLLHKKTLSYEDCDISFYDNIYNNILDKVNDLESYYLKLNEEIENEIYMSPSNYLLVRNISKIYSDINYIKEEVNTWYDNIKDKTKKKVSIINNNLDDTHIINDIVISWDNYEEDLPIIDIYKYYKNVYDKYPFINIFKKYVSKNKPSEEEILLFFILISLPDKIEFTSDEYKNVERVNKMLNYIFKTDNFISEYYSNNEKKE